MKYLKTQNQLNEGQENLNISDVSGSEKFTPSSDMWYVYFNFYTNDDNDIDDFKKELKENNPFILGFVEDTGMFGSKRVLVYVSTEYETKKLKNKHTLEIYQKYVGDGGYKVK